jgi:hypothetical protein
MRKEVLNFTFLAIFFYMFTPCYSQGVTMPVPIGQGITIYPLAHPVPAPIGVTVKPGDLSWNDRVLRDDKGDAYIPRATQSSAIRARKKKIAYPLWNDGSYPMNPGELDHNNWNCTKPELGEEGYYEYEWTGNGAHAGERLRFWPRLKLWQHSKIEGGRVFWHNGRFWDALETFMQIP